MENRISIVKNGFHVQNTNKKLPRNAVEDDCVSLITEGIESIVQVAANSVDDCSWESIIDLTEDDSSQNSLLVPVKYQNVPERNLNLNYDFQINDKTFCCDICGEIFDLNYQLKNHKANEHTKKSQVVLNPHKCKYCGKKFKLKFGLNRHIQKCHMHSYKSKNIADKSSDENIETIEDGTDKNIVSIPNLKLCKRNGVWKSKPNIIIYNCKICLLQFDCQNSLTKHMKMHKNNDDKSEILCKDCNKYISVDEVNDHMLLFHNKTQFKCQKCELRFDNNQILNLHLSNCTKSSRDIWNKFRGKADIKPSYNCTICGTSFAILLLLKHHMALGCKHYSCKYCGKIFSTKDLLSEHMDDFQKYKCCDKSSNAIKTSASMSHNQNLVVNDINRSVHSENSPCTSVTIRNIPDQIDKSASISNKSILQSVRKSHDLMANDNSGNVRYENIPCTVVTENNNSDQINQEISIKSIIPIVSQNLMINNHIISVKKENGLCKNTSRINNSSQINAANRVSATQTASNNIMTNYCGLNIKKEKISSIENVTDMNGLEYFDQTDAANNAESTLLGTSQSSHNLFINNCDLNIKKEKFTNTYANENNGSDIRDASYQNNLILQTTPLTNTINNIRVKKEPEDYNVVRETEYISINKLQNFQNVSSMTPNLNCDQPYSNVVYVCKICKKNISVDLHSFAVHMSSHIECSVHECVVCDEKFSSVLLWTTHMTYHEQQIDLNLSNSEINHNEVELTNITTNSENMEPQVLSTTLGNSGNNSPKIKVEPIYSSSSNITSVNNCAKKLKKQFTCNICSKILPSKTILITHQRLHGVQNRKANLTPNVNSRPFHCKYCDKTFSSRGPCTNHEKSHLPKDNVVIIEGSIHQPDEMQNGIQIENGDPIPIISHKKKKQVLKTSRVYCTLCRKRFARQCYLSNHMKLYHKISPKCPEIQLGKSSNLNSGINNINSEKSVNKMISTELNTNPSVSVDRNLNNSVDASINSVSASNYCKMCNRQFSGPVSLSNHMRIHSKDFPFKCQYCPRKFSGKGAYTNHIKSHNKSKEKLIVNINNTDLSIVKIERNEEHQPEENCNNSELVNSSFIDQPSITNLTKKNRLWFPCDVCEKKYSTPFQLIIHRRSHYNIQPYLCKICDKLYDVRHQWNRHLKSHYRKSKLNNKSNQPTNTTKLCMSKIKIEPEQHKNQFKCRYCKKGYNSISQWKKHMTLSKECRRHCKSNVPDFTSLQGRENYTKSKRVECNICKKTYSTSYNRKIHMINVHKLLSATDLDTSTNTNINEPIIQIKTETVQQNSKLLNQSKISMISSNDGGNQCKLCGKSYSNRANLYRHHKISHTMDHKVVHCTFCNRPFKHQYSLTVHLRRKHRQQISSKNAMGNKKNIPHIKPLKRAYKRVIAQYFCKICKMKFSDNIKLEQHIQTHYLNKYKCKDCSQVFETNVILGEHILNNHSVVSTTLNVNNHAENFSIQGTSSQTIYNTIDCLQCKICSKILKSSSYLAAHMRVHTGVKPFKCDLCNMHFRFKPNLRIHKSKIHYQATASI